MEHVVDVALMLDAFAALTDLPDPIPAHFTKEVQIEGDLWIGQIDRSIGLKDQIADACQPRGLNYTPPVRNYPVNYAIYRKAAPTSPLHTWDPDRRLWTIMQLTRLVRPTSLGPSNAARLIYDSRNAVIQIMPSRMALRYFVAIEEENWIRDEDLPLIRDLAAAFTRAALPERVLRAMWFYEYAFQQAYLDARWALISIGLEALVHTDERGRSSAGSTRQFTNRTAALMHRVGRHDVTGTELRDNYERRSAIAHGQPLTDAMGADKAAYIRLEGILASALRAAIQHPNVAAIFATTDAVRRALPA